MGKLLSKAMPAWYPLPRRAKTQLLRMSSHPRMQRSQRMQASWSTLIASDESSWPRGVVRVGNRGLPIPDWAASRSNSQVTGILLLARTGEGGGLTSASSTRVLSDTWKRPRYSS